MNILTQIAVAKIDAPKNGITDIGANDVMLGVLNTVYFISGAAAVIVIIIAGILYTISDGDSGKVSKAKNAILYAVVGLVIIMGAFVITGFISGRF